MEEVTEESAELVEGVAALDIGKKSLTACVRVPHESRAGARRQKVRTCATTTPALLELRDWLICQGVTRVVMEATSAYWKPPFYLLEDHIECYESNPGDYSLFGVQDAGAKQPRRQGRARHEWPQQKRNKRQVACLEMQCDCQRNQRDSGNEPAAIADCPPAKPPCQRQRQ